MLTTHRRKDRPLEWFLAGFSVLWGGAAALGPGLWGVAALQPTEVSAGWAMACVLLGLLHMIGLLVNGTASWTPLLRLLATAANAGFFAHVAAVAFVMHPDAPGWEVVVCGYIAIGFAWCAWVAGQDTARMRLGTYGL